MTAKFLLNSGRVSSQSIHQAIKLSEFSGVVEHEPIRAQYRPRMVLRNPDTPGQILQQDRKVRDKIHQIDSLIEQGVPYVSVGWTCFSWADFFLDRWGDDAAFTALVRNPYSVAASLLTHNFFVGRDDSYMDWAIIQNDAHVHYKALSATHADFSPFEKCVFHWMELYRYILEFRARKDFHIWKFEDLYGDKQAWRGFFKDLSGVELREPPGHVDKYRGRIKSDVSFDLREQIAAPCRELCLELGYEPQFVDGLDALRDTLHRKYVERNE